MVSVTRRVTEVKQPRGGYIKPKEFSVIELSDGIDLYPEENIHPTLIGIAVDYMTRFTLGTSLQNAFRVSLQGAFNIKEFEYASDLLNEVKGLDDNSIKNACKMVGYDIVYRAGATAYTPVQNIEPDIHTISNVRTMIERSIAFNEKYGPIIKDSFTFEGGYNKTIDTGDGDFLTETTLWDFKVSKSGPTNKHTLQLLIYYLMGLRSIHPEFKSIKELGVFNPRLNTVYLLDINDISPEILSEVSSEVIGY